jgi:hypothetical protein
MLDVGTRRIVHWNVTEHPTADWTLQQCRAVITGETAHRFLIHDRDGINDCQCVISWASGPSRCRRTATTTPDSL